MVPVESIDLDCDPSSVATVKEPADCTLKVPVVVLTMPAGVVEAASVAVVSVVVAAVPLVERAAVPVPSVGELSRMVPVDPVVAVVVGVEVVMEVAVRTAFVAVVALTEATAVGFCSATANRQEGHWPTNGWAVQ